MSGKKAYLRSQLGKQPPVAKLSGVASQPFTKYNHMRRHATSAASDELPLRTMNLATQAHARITA